MSARRLAKPALFVALALIIAIPMYGAKRTVKAVPKIDPQALTMLQQMGQYLQELQSFSVHVDTSRDLVSPSAQTLTSDQSFDLYVQRPDKFRINMTSAAGGANVFYNGSTLTIYTPGKNFYAQVAAPPTIRGALQEMMKRGIEMPLASLLQREPGQQITANIVSGIHVGTSMVNGIAAHQLAFRGKQVDWQVWIQNDPSAPLPVKVMIIDRRVSGSPRYTAYLSGWDTNGTFNDSLFNFTPPAGAQKIGFSTLPKQPRTFIRGTKRALTK